MAARCAGYFLHGQLESGSLCPITMTFASIPILRNEPAPARAEIRRDLIDTFDPVLNDLLRSIECGEVS